MTSNSPRLILYSLALTMTAALLFWIESQFRSPILQALVGVFCLAAFATAVFALKRRLSHQSLQWNVRAMWKFSLFSALIFIFALGGLGTWLAYSRAGDIVHPARVPIGSKPEIVGISDYQSVTFLSADGLTLHGWYIPPKNGAVVIFVHGLGSNRSMFWDDVAMLHPHGYGILLFDLRNSGTSEGEITTMGLLEAGDVDSAVEFVLAQPGVDAQKIVLFGHSMGGATVILSAAGNPKVRAVIAQSAYTSLEDNVSASMRQLTGLPAFPFAPLVVFFGEHRSGMQIRQVRPVDVVADISPRPILLVHGAQDLLVPVSNVYDLYAAAQEPKELLVIQEAGHGGFAFHSPQTYPAQILNFLENALR
jgi:uncharacterized protein